jgi:hypothetical protein
MKYIIDIMKSIYTVFTGMNLVGEVFGRGLQETGEGIEKKISICNRNSTVVK